MYYEIIQFGLCKQYQLICSKSFSQVIDKRFPKLFEYSVENKEFILAALSIPAIKADFIQDDGDFAFAKQLLIDECKQLQPAPESVIEQDEEQIGDNCIQNKGFLCFKACSQ